MTGRAVEVLAVPAGPDALTILPALHRALAGVGPVLLPVPTAGPGRRTEPDLSPLTPDEDDLDDPTALVVSTSGSTGDPKGTLLPVSALRASAAATQDRLGGPGSWLLALPGQHIAGLQVLIRSILAGTAPVVMDLREGFSPNGFIASTQELRLQPGTSRRYTSLVPT
ncbi:MAG: AMP-binding protein, partial [Actinomycetota bacterium]|nr:AMP-binding protein [Actinomycetota bacterium]